MGNGEARFGVVKHNQLSRGGYLEAWDISPGQLGSWILTEREGGPEKAYQPAGTEATVLSVVSSPGTTMGHLDQQNTKRLLLPIQGNRCMIGKVFQASTSTGAVTLV